MKRKSKQPARVVRTQNQTVLLGPAYVWQCPLCGEINFDVPRHLRPGQYERIGEQVDNAPEENVYCNPGAVECVACSKVFRSIAFPDGDLNIHVVDNSSDEDGNDESGIDLLKDAEDWSDGEP